MIICGIDPGLDGAFAFYNTEALRVESAFSMPTMTLAKGKGTRREISWRSVVLLLEKFSYPIDYTFVERVASSPQQGVTSAFNFGRGYGGIECLVACMQWPVEFIIPGKWKKALAVPAEKDDAVRRADQLMPGSAHWWQVKRGEITKAAACGIAEASLIAYYGMTFLAERGLLPRTPPGKTPRRKLRDVA